MKEDGTSADGTMESAAEANDPPSVLQKLQKWGDYPGMGDAVWPTRFLPMKTPLSMAILDAWHLPEQPKHRLTVQDLLRQAHAHGRRVGLIIDLSNHETLYKEDIPPQLCYEHVQLIAKVFPQPHHVAEVIRIAEAFWEQHPEQFIAIHCAYGFNRTGFVVCSYLVQACGLSVDEALQAFATARPPGVKHERFIEELRRRYATHRAASETGSTSSRGVTDPKAPAARQPGHMASPSSLNSLPSDFHPVAEHLGRQCAEQQRPPRRPPAARPHLRNSSQHAVRPGSSPAASSDGEYVGAPDDGDGLPGAAAPRLQPIATQLGGERRQGRPHRVAAQLSHLSMVSNESLGCSQRSLATALRQEESDLVTNPSLGFGVSELQSAMRPRRDPLSQEQHLPTVSSETSLQDTAASEGSVRGGQPGSARTLPGTPLSPGLVSPFASVGENAGLHGPSGVWDAAAAEAEQSERAAWDRNAPAAASSGSAAKAGPAGPRDAVQEADVSVPTGGAPRSQAVPIPGAAAGPMGRPGVPQDRAGPAEACSAAQPAAAGADRGPLPVAAAQNGQDPGSAPGSRPSWRGPASTDQQKRPRPAAERRQRCTIS